MTIWQEGERWIVLGDGPFAYMQTFHTFIEAWHDACRLAGWK